jgi:uncharacterized protein (DUF1800 family)
MWAAFAHRARAQAGISRGRPATDKLLPTGDLRFLVDRITNGWNAEVWAHVQAVEYAPWLEEQLAPASIDDSAMTAMLAPFTTLSMTSKQIYDTYVVNNQTAVPVLELETAAVLRGAYSKRQLFERMVEFWTDHFNIDHADGQAQWLKTADDRDVIRAHALGNFRDLLLASAQSGAMLYYLDNYSNFASAPNENYSREIMELHSLGVGNYTETDVVELARCLTGWQFWNQTQPNYGDFRFNSTVHDNGAKTVLGHSIPAGGGVNDGLQMVDILALHPTTAQFLARKLCIFFLAYDPPQAVVDRVASAYLASGADIKATVREVLSARTVELVPAPSRPKLKRPFHLVCSVIRTCNPAVAQPQRFVSELALMGHQPMRWSPPNGYPDTADYWGTAVLPRWSFLTKLFAGGIAGTTVDVAQLFGGTPKNRLASMASEILFGGGLAPEDAAAVQAYADAAPTLNNALRRDVLALSASSPSFQYV